MKEKWFCPSCKKNVPYAEATGTARVGYRTDTFPKDIDILDIWDTEYTCPTCERPVERQQISNK